MLALFDITRLAALFLAREWMIFRRGDDWIEAVELVRTQGCCRRDLLERET
jgi:hypothetical protein